MSKHFLLAQIALLIICCSEAYAYVMTFDDIATGSDLDYYAEQYNAYFTEGFQVTDHSACTWGSPNSGNNVLTWVGTSSQDAWLTFGNMSYGGPITVGQHSIRSLCAFFSTDGVQVLAKAYRMDTVTPVCIRQIGATDVSWDNEYVDLVADDGGVIDYIKFEGAYTPAARMGFCVDDINVDPVPEPSSILALVSGVIGYGGLVLKRKRHGS
ncbi:MAG: PEP-CTERM sorting domain-containing protein [Armatimonadota bacterium]